VTKEKIVSDFSPIHQDRALTIEVVAYRNGIAVDRRLCESAAQAAAVVAHLEEQPGVECEVLDLSTAGGESAAEVPEPDDGYPYEPEVESYE
jgi:hypothetical protein